MLAVVPEAPTATATTATVAATMELVLYRPPKVKMLSNKTNQRTNIQTRIRNDGGFSSTTKYIHSERHHKYFDKNDSIGVRTHTFFIFMPHSTMISPIQLNSSYKMFEGVILGEMN